jgi:hypothetical protein
MDYRKYSFRIQFPVAMFFKSFLKKMINLVTNQFTYRIPFQLSEPLRVRNRNQKKEKKMKNKLYIVTTVLMFQIVPSMLYAQILDGGPARGPDLSDEPTLSAEGQILIGGADFIGARVNFLLSETLLVFGDVGTVDIGDALSFGGGAMMNLDLGLPVDTAVRGTFHMASEDDVSVWSAKGQFLVGADLNSVDGMSWFGHAGLGFVSIEYDTPEIVTPLGVIDVDVDLDDSEVYVLLGGGVVYEMDTLPLEVFAGIDLIVGDLYDDVVIGLGARWSF